MKLFEYIGSGIFEMAHFERNGAVFNWTWLRRPEPKVSIPETEEKILSGQKRFTMRTRNGRIRQFEVKY